MNGKIVHRHTQSPYTGVHSGTNTDDIQIGRSNGNLIGKFACASFFDVAVDETHVKEVMERCKQRLCCKFFLRRLSSEGGHGEVATVALL